MSQPVTAPVAARWELHGGILGSLRAVGPPLAFGLRLWASVCLALYVTFWLQLDNGYWAGASAAVVCQPHLGASLRKGWHRMIGTIVGAVAIVVLTAYFPQQRAPFLVGLALWGAASALVATLCRNFASYAAALAGYTAAIIASDQLGATGGPNGDAFMLAVTRVSEIGIGIVCAGVVVSATDFGSASRVLARRFAALSAEIGTRFTAALVCAQPETPEGRQARRELVGDVAALDPVLDEAIGESSEIREHVPVLQDGVDGLFAALAGWRAVAERLDRMREPTAREAIVRAIPRELRSALAADGAARWMAAPGHMRDLLHTTLRSLAALPAGTPSLRLLRDETARVLTGLTAALDGLGALAADPARTQSSRRAARLVVHDWLPALVNAGRAFATIAAVELCWIWTAWPHGAIAVTWAAIGVTLYAPRADTAYVDATAFMTGNTAAAALAGVAAFAVLPAISTFEGFIMVLGMFLIPAGALAARSQHPVMLTAMAANFVPLLTPANQMTYDPAQFANNATAILGGCGAAALAFRLLPPLSPTFRAARLVARTFRDLRALAARPVPDTPRDWERRVYGLLSVLPAEASHVQRGALTAALSTGIAIARLRDAGAALDSTSDVDRALTALARGDVPRATASFEQLDRRLALQPSGIAGRASVRAITDALAQYTDFFTDRR